MAQVPLTREVAQFNVAAYGAVKADLTLLDLGYVLLIVAQQKYPAATDLTNKADWCAWQGAINAANAALGGDVMGEAGSYYTHAKITQKAFVSCYGVVGRTIIQTDSVSYDGWEVNTGVVMTNNVVTSGIHVRGPNAPSLANEVSLGLTSAFKYNNSTQCRSYECTGSNYSILLDLVNNNYNCAFTNLNCPRFSSTIWGVYLRNGGNSGSDLYFWNPQLHCMRACWVMDGGGGGYYVYGGQFGAGNLLNAPSDGTGVIMLNYRLSDGGSSGTLAQVLFDGGSVEGWHYNWGIRVLNRTSVTFRNMSFQATETSATKALGLIKGTTLDNSMIRFDACEIGGGSGSYFANDPWCSFAGHSQPFLVEHGWKTSYASGAINANGRVISGFGATYGIIATASSTGLGSGYGIGSAHQWFHSNGFWWRGTTSPTGGSVLYVTTNPATTSAVPLGLITESWRIGDAATLLTTGTLKYTWVAPRKGAIDDINAVLSVAQALSGGGGIVTFDILKTPAAGGAATSIFGANKLTLLNGQRSTFAAGTTAKSIAATTFAQGDTFDVSITQLGSPTTAAGATINFVWALTN